MCVMHELVTMKSRQMDYLARIIYLFDFTSSCLPIQFNFGSMNEMLSGILLLNCLFLFSFFLDLEEFKWNWKRNKHKILVFIFGLKINRQLKLCHSHSFRSHLLHIFGFDFFLKFHTFIFSFFIITNS